MPVSQVDHAAETAEKTLRDAEKRLAALADRAEKAIYDGLETLREQTKAYAETAGESFDHAQKYVSERVQERPLTATLAALGVGVLVGFLLAGRRSER